MRRLLILLAVSAAFTAAAQLQLPSTLPGMPAGANPNPAPAVSNPNPAGRAPGAPGLMSGFVPDESYKLRVGDTVSFQITEDEVWDFQNEPKSLVVQDSGELEVPYIGRVMAVGKTCKVLAEEIKASLEKDYYKQATVVISMQVASPVLGRVYVWGQVRNQGALDVLVNENLTVGQAIMRAGGFADFANQRKVKVIRSGTGTEAGKPEQPITLDMEQILNEGKTEKDIVLQPGDLIIVPSRLINF